MKVLLTPMCTIAETSGPFERVKVLADECMKRGHSVRLCTGRDCNYEDIKGVFNYEAPIPSPFGMPAVIGNKMFSIAQKTGIQQKKKVNSFEEVLHIVGAISGAFYERDVNCIIKAIEDYKPDIVFSEFRPAALTAAKIKGIKSACSISYPVYKCSTKKTGLLKQVNKLHKKYGLPSVESVVDLFNLANIKFVSSIYELEPIEDSNVIYTGPYKKTNQLQTYEYSKRNNIIVYMGNGTITPSKMYDEIKNAFLDESFKVYIASKQLKEKDYKNIVVRKRLDFTRLLGESIAFINHGGQNSIMDGILYHVPQIICPGEIFERKCNGYSVQNNGIGVVIDKDSFKASNLKELVKEIVEDRNYYDNAICIAKKLDHFTGVGKVVCELEQLYING